MLKDMTCISKYVNDPETNKVLIAKDKGKEGENGSIGTSATRGTIIIGLIKRGYLKEEKQKKIDIFVSTPKGRAFYYMLPDNIKTADVTAKWWLVQEEIKNGGSPDQLPNTVLNTVKEVISSGKGENAALQAKKQSLTKVGVCPECGKDLVKRSGKYGIFAACRGFSECYVRK